MVDAMMQTVAVTDYEEIMNQTVRSIRDELVKAGYPSRGLKNEIAERLVQVRRRRNELGTGCHE